MKQFTIILFTLLAWVIEARADVEISEANFPDASFRAVLADLPEGKDGVLTDGEIAGLQRLVLTDGRSENIKSLKGIEHLTALGYLEMFFANIKELDLTQNKALGVLRLGLASLDRLDLSDLTDLVYLHLEVVMGIKELDLSGCTALEYLYCKTSDFERLNIQDCKELKELWCYECKLKKLELSSFPHLKKLYCGYNDLTKLDLSVVPELEELDCGGNPLGSLDVSKNTVLRGLWCPDNSLTSLDLSANKQLCLLNCSHNDIGSESMTALLTSLPQADSGGQLYLRNMEYGEEHNNCSEEQEQIAVSKNWTILLQLPSVVGGHPLNYLLDIDTPLASQPQPDNNFYTLDGRRIPTIHSLSSMKDALPQKGIYIHNGRKVVIK